MNSDKSIILGPNRRYPSLPEVTSNADSHQRALEAIIEALQIHERRVDRAVMDSFVRVRDLEDVGLVDVEGKLMTPTTEEGWDDITADLGGGKTAGANVPTWSTFRNGIQAYQFSASQMKEVWITFHVKHDYKDGTAVYPHIHFSPTGGGTGVVRWGFEYSVARGHDQEAFPTTTTVYVNYNIATSKQYQHLIAEVTDADAFDAYEADTLILMRVFRDAANAADTFAGTVHAFTADIHFQGDRQFTKYKSPPFVD